LLSYSTLLKRRLGSHINRSQCARRTSSPGSFVCPSAGESDTQVSPTAPRRMLLWMTGTNRSPCSAFMVSLQHDGLLCAPAPDVLQSGTDHGVHCVSAFPEPELGTNPALGLCQEASPQRGSYPSTNSPRQQPYRITAAVTLLRLPLVPHVFPPAPKSRFCATLRAPGKPVALHPSAETDGRVSSRHEKQLFSPRPKSLSEPLPVPAPQLSRSRAAVPSR